jgi:hypothetical protein
MTWLDLDPRYLRWAVIAGVSLSVVSLAILPIAILRMPPEYFVGPEPPPSMLSKLHPVLAVTLRIARNALGVALLLLGTAMLVLPGQGLLCILVGLGCLDFPGKRRLEQRMVANPRIHRALNWIRERGGKPPFL